MCVCVWAGNVYFWCRIHKPEQQVGHFAILIHRKSSSKPALFVVLCTQVFFYITASIYSPQLQRREMNPPTRRHRGTHPAAKQLTCYNLHVVFCFCPGSSCKTRPFLHCSGPAAVLRGGEKTQQANIIFSLRSCLNQQLLHKISSAHWGVESSVLSLHF